MKKINIQKFSYLAPKIVNPNAVEMYSFLQLDQWNSDEVLATNDII